MGKLIPNVFNLMVVMTVAIGSAACSYGMAVIGGTLGQPMFYNDLNLAPQGEPGYAHTADIISAMNGLNSAGAAFGALSTAWTVNKWGRLRSIQIGAVILIIGAILCAASQDVAMFLVARLIVGLGIGILITAIPMYQAEVSTPESRGFMVSMHGIMFTVGYLLSAWIGFGCYFSGASGSKSSFAWRFPLAFQTAPAIVLLVASLWLPFSPRWLLQVGREEESHNVIRRLHSSKDDIHHTVAAKEFYQMRKQLQLDRRTKANTSAFELFKTSSNRKRAWVGFSLMFGNQFTGAQVIANYGVLLYQSLGMTTYMPLLLAALWTTSSLPGNLFTAVYVDRFGRRVFLLVGIVGILVTLILETIMQALYLGTSNTSGQKAAVFFIFLFIFFWSFCVDATQYLYLAEIYPTHLRGAGMALGTFGLYASSLIWLIAGPIALNNIGWKFFLVLIVPLVFHGLNVFFFFPETKQRSLEDINATFGEEVAVHYFGATATEEAQYAQAIADEEEVQLKAPNAQTVEHVEQKG